MLETTLALIWLFLPAGFSNSAAAVAVKIKFLKFLAIPIDMGLEMNGQRLLGKNKTVRGFLCGTLFAVFMAFVQKLIYENVGLDSLFELNYEGGEVLILGALLGFGALFGDSVESFFKRRINIKPGEPWFPFDQTDYIFGSLLIGGWYMNKFVDAGIESYLVLILFFFLSHLVVKFTGYHLGLDDKKI